MSFPIPEPYQWDATFDVKNPEINEQHKKLFVLINDLAAHKADAHKLKVLLDYVLMHFATEEKLFHEKHWAADKAAAHKAIHDKFVTDAVTATKAGVDDGIIAFLKKWLVEHIKGSDMQYAGSI
jgi:hemerythrin family non-heme iron protein